jgi:hypothetical protein
MGGLPTLIPENARRSHAFPRVAAWRLTMCEGGAGEMRTKQIQKELDTRTEGPMLRSLIADLAELVCLASFVGFIAVLA